MLVLPLLAVAGVSSMRLLQVGQEASDAERVAQLAELGTDISNLSRLLHDERMAAVEFLATPDGPVTGFREAVKAVDSQAREFRTDRAAIVLIPERVETRLTAIEAQLGSLTDLRTAVDARSVPGLADVAQRYGAVLAGLDGYENLLSQIAERGEVADGLRTVAAFTELESAATEQAALAYIARATDSLDAERQRALIAAQATRASALADLREVATRDQVALVDSVLADPAIARADELSARLTGDGAAGLDEVSDAFGDVTVLFRGVERQLEEQTVTLAEDARTSTTRLATVEFITVLVVLIATVTIAVYLGRSLLLSVRRLREGALAVASRDLPEAVSLLQDVESLGEGGVDRIVAQSRDPINLADRDEFGEVAEAFNMVHREAIRVAAEQAALRISLSTMFLSLARRSQSLVDRMIGELDQIERMEEDPKRLARLFELDHLATRMRRNDENVLVLAGAEVGTPRREDALLIDALRAAQSEIELYHRIEFGTVDTDVLITAAAVNDVVRLIAELLDNATRFSAPDTVVMAQAGRLGEHAVIRIEDRGLGISAEQMEQLNIKLSEPADVDASVFRLMGIAVIGRLASRHGIRVELRPGPEGGVVAEVTLPADIIVMPGAPSPLPPRAASWTRPGPPPQLPIGIPRSPEARPVVRTAPPPAPAPVRTAPLGVPMSELDLNPTPNRPKLPTRVPKPVDPVPAAEAAPEPPPPLAPPASIQMEMQHSWFEGEDEKADSHGMPTAGYAPPPTPPTAPAQPAPKPRPTNGDERWRTAADEGWHRAMAASDPKDAGITRSGLPKRIPQAQLVPGGVEATPRAQQRRSPDEVRGLLSAYHRGVQRGRTDGVAETAAAATQAPKENEQ
ncbi:nitrate- and nitrite sensing domain-containing protein [Actinoplanes sichuanensis]|uniref:histidine kinase n=1 Tax=Actinoplanes sichuanensis TaxID=512349 RepID=A0ABW4AD33_9ACTN|nr:nitrate- and nitrite sensing domain-containing protein [Actinoplanes sichuanensis]BEL09960.1 nitrate- and nitrite sensing domain-containing protein [Actinoplanes sichuanensis]